MDRNLDVITRMKGPIAAICPCFEPDGSVNFPAVKRYVNWLCQQKVPVLMLTYGSTEFMSLTEAEIWRLTEDVAEAAAGRSLVIAATDWWKTTKCRGFLKHADRVGADVVMVEMHPWLDKTPKLVLDFFDQIQDVCDIPLLAWADKPGQFPVEVVPELAKRPQVVGMKNDGHPLFECYDYIRAAPDQDFVVICAGQMRSFMFGYQVGSPAYLCTIGFFRPDISLEFYDLLVAHRYDDAWQMVFRYEEPWMRCMGRMPWGDVMRSSLHLHGLYPHNRPCPPSPELPAKDYEKLRSKLAKVFGGIRKAGL